MVSIKPEKESEMDSLMASPSDLKSKKSKGLSSTPKNFDDIGIEDLSGEEFQDIFDVMELLIRVENRLRSERLEKPLKSA